MKTIDGVAEEYTLRKVSDLCSYYAESEEFIENLSRTIMDAFIAGAKAFQEWISVDDELPEYGELVLVKVNNEADMLSTARYQGGGNFSVDCQELYRYNITHWQPIEYK